MATYGKITIVKRPNVPPSFLGECSITVAIGQTVIITKNTLMNTLPPYQHILSDPTPEIGSVKITGWIGQNYKNFLSQSNNSNTYGILYKDTTRIYQNSSGSLINNTVTKNELWTNKFKVTGVSQGHGIIKYRATAFDTMNNNESVFSETEGKIEIIVIDPNNLPPTHVNDGEVTCELGNSVVLGYDFFCTNFLDPEGDPPKEVRIDTLPPTNKGHLAYNGIVLNSSMLPLYIDVNDLNMGVLVYVGIGDLTIGEEVVFSFKVSDAGSGQFTP